MCKDRLYYQAVFIVKLDTFERISAGWKSLPDMREYSMSKEKLLLQFLTMIIFVSGCSLVSSNTSSKDASFLSLFSDCELNSSLEFLPLQSNYRFNDSVMLTFRNTSSDQIAYFPEEGLGIFVYEDNDGWTMVENDLKYSVSPEPYLVVGSSNDYSSHQILVISPNIPSIEIEDIRVVIFGYIYKNKKVSDKCVGRLINHQTGLFILDFASQFPVDQCYWHQTQDANQGLDDFKPILQSNSRRKSKRSYKMRKRLLVPTRINISATCKSIQTRIDFMTMFLKDLLK